MLNTRIRDVRVMKWVEERIGGSVLQQFRNTERMGNDRIAERVYVGECVGISLEGRPWRRWTDSVNDCLKKRGLKDE